ncbi:MAG: radical SAM protein [Oligoflexia bacterium]|nr:radical SAM protein [Oligoflexia bacterium]
MLVNFDKINFFKTNLKARGPLGVIKRYLSRRLCMLRKIPYNVQIEITNFCNLKCPYCSASLDVVDCKKQSMSFLEFQKIVDALKRKRLYYPTLSLYFRGEPLLNQEVILMIEYATGKGCDVTISTNGSMLQKAEFRQKILQSGLHLLILSIDGASKETYNKSRVGEDFERIISFSKAIVAEKRALKLRKPFIEWQYVITRETEAEMDAAKRMSQKIGMDNIRFKTFKLNFFGKELAEVLSHAEKYNPINPRYSRYTIKDNQIALKDYLPRCESGLNCVVYVDGSVTTCCEDVGEKHKGRNVLQDDFWSVWNSKEYKSKRKAACHKQLDICRYCN